jgi:hypothetical protein
MTIADARLGALLILRLTNLPKTLKFLVVFAQPNLPPG